MNTPVKKELVAMAEFLIRQHNALTSEFGENDYEEGVLTKVIADANIGTVEFDNDRVATIKYRTSWCRDDV